MPAKTTKKKLRKKEVEKRAWKPAPKSAPGSVRRSAPTQAAPSGAKRPLQEEVQAALSWLKQRSTRRDRENLARFGITANKAFGRML